MSMWLNDIRQAAVAGEASVLVSVVAARGSAPREPGASMVVSPTRLLGTIGGGNLEYLAIARAREALAGSSPLPEGGEVQRFVLGTDLRQCCGGVAFLHFEAFEPTLPPWLLEAARLLEAGEPAVLLSRRCAEGVARAVVTAAGFRGDASLKGAEAVARQGLTGWERGQDLLWSATGEKPRDPEKQSLILLRPMITGDFRLLLFGAGHVGRALVRVLEPLVDQIIWSDGREDEFPSELAANVRAETGDPFALIEGAPPGSLYLLMTHNHALDLALCEAVLQRRDYGYLGLIGSAAKRQRFERHLREEGLTDADLERLVCPIGVAGISSKQPAAIAVAVAAELLQVRERLAAAAGGSLRRSA